MNERHYLLKIRIIEYKLIPQEGLDINFRRVAQWPKSQNRRMP